MDVILTFVTRVTHFCLYFGGSDKHKNTFNLCKAMQQRVMSQVRTGFHVIVQSWLCFSTTQWPLSTQKQIPKISLNLFACLLVCFLSMGFHMWSLWNTSKIPNHYQLDDSPHHLKTNQFYAIAIIPKFQIPNPKYELRSTPNFCVQRSHIKRFGQLNFNLLIPINLFYRPTSQKYKNLNGLDLILYFLNGPNFLV